MDDPPHIVALKRFLLDLPSAHNFQLTDNTKKSIRRALFLAISEDGKYFDWLFPKLAAGANGASVLNIMEKELDWLYAKYDRMVSKMRDATHTGHNDHAYHAGLPCARIFRRGEPIYKCLTCGFDECCALCSYCYQPENHEGHTVQITVCLRENGGVCDCGDPEAWVNEYVCKYAEEDKDYASFKTRDVPEDLALSIFRTLEILLDYIIDVMCQSDSQFFSVFELAMAHTHFAENCTLDPRKYGYDDTTINHDQPSEKYSLIAYNDQVRHFRDAVQRIHLASKKVPEFATMVAQKVQTHGRATVIRSRNVSVLVARQRVLSATGLASCIRNARDEFREDMCHEIILWMSSLTGCEIFKSNTTLKNLFCRAFCRKWNKGLLAPTSNHQLDYCRGKLCEQFTIPHVESIKERDPNNSHWVFKPTPWAVSPHLRDECDVTQDISEDRNGGFLGTRFQYMVYFDIRFWKSIRTVLHDIYSNTLITNLKYKGLICCLYVDVYPAITDTFLSIDGEPEVSVMCTLSTQLFTCPSNSTSIIAHGDVSRIFSAIHSFLQTGHVRILSFIDRDKSKILMSSLKNRRWGQIFFDIGYILSRGKDRELILTSNIIPMACDILVLFQGKPVMKRERESHVEYENSDYTAFFHAILVIFQFAEYIAHCTTNLDQQQRETVSQNAICYVIQYLLHLENAVPDTTSNDYNDVDYGQAIENVHLISKSLNTLDDVKVSFLHPIHSFLSWLIEFSSFGSSTKLFTVFTDAIETFIRKSPEDHSFMSCITTIFDYPLRAVVLCSQIKSGFWVRNGFSARSQLQLYKNTGLREQGYLRDLFLIQIFTVSCEPDLVIELILKRWLLFHGWANGTDSKCSYEGNALPYIIEEFLTFIMHILTEDLFLRGSTSDETTYNKIKNEIIHNLCFGPMSYSRLCAQVPEHISSEKRFDIVLKELTTFKNPKTSKDTGTYALKERYFEEINPYYFNYTTNKRDDAIHFVKERIQKGTNLHFHDIVIKPKLRVAHDIGIYKQIGAFTSTRLFRDFLVRTFNFVLADGIDKLDGILESILHLVHTCALEEFEGRSDTDNFFFNFCDTSKTFDTSLAAQTYALLLKEEFKNHHSKVRAIFAAFVTRFDDAIQLLSTTIPNFDITKLDLVAEHKMCESETERKKRVAKERQAKLLAKFKKQQSLFVKMNNICTECSDTEMEDLEEEGWKFPDSHCILCQDTAQDAGPFGIITYISKSSEFRDVPFDDKFWFLKAFSDSANLCENEDEGCIPESHSEKWKTYMKKVEADHVVGPGFTSQKHVHSKLVSLTCGHGMHFNCYMQFLANNRAKLSQITRNTPESIEHREFLCPLCNAINNMFIPILWTSNNRSLAKFIAPPDPDLNAFDSLLSQTIHDDAWFQEFCRTSTQDVENFSILTPLAKEMIDHRSDLSLPNQKQFKVLFSNMFQILSLLTFPQVFKADSSTVLINSIQSTEILLRGTTSHSKIVSFQVSNNNLINLRALNEFRVTSLLMKISNWIETPSSKPNAHVKILANLIALSPDFFNHTVTYSNFFEVLVNLLPFPSASFSFNSILHTCLTGVIIQDIYMITSQILSHDFYSNDYYNVLDIPYSEMITEKDAELATQIFKKLKMGGFESSTYESIISNPKFGYVIFSMLLKSITPFLRQCAIYAYVCCPNCEDLDVNEPESLIFEADLLCRFMKIPTLSEMLRRLLPLNSASPTWESKRLHSFVSFLKKTSERASLEETRIKKSMDYPGVIRLAKLPDRLDYFFTRYYYLDKYQNPHLSIENPAICLSCCEVMDVQKSAIGSPYGQCTVHYLKECSNNSGIFLLPKERCLLLLHKNGGSFYDAPYLDQHGELPGENKKGKPVFLLKERYENFTRNVWLQHNIPNYIVRKLDGVIDAGGWVTL